MHEYKTSLRRFYGNKAIRIVKLLYVAWPRIKE